MNYRHAFHAGNIADVVKHAVLARIVAHLKEKPAAFRVLDTHAGAGLYDLAGPEASRTGEWRDGIGKLIAAALDAGRSATCSRRILRRSRHSTPGRSRSIPARRRCCSIGSARKTA